MSEKQTLIAHLCETTGLQIGWGKLALQDLRDLSAYLQSKQTTTASVEFTMQRPLIEEAAELIAGNEGKQVLNIARTVIRNKINGAECNDTKPQD